jgi:hypothetical protein
VKFKAQSTLVNQRVEGSSTSSLTKHGKLEEFFCRLFYIFRIADIQSICHNIKPAIREVCFKADVRMPLDERRNERRYPLAAERYGT